MARITVEDCTEKVTDRFKLVALAAQRAKNINAGAEIVVDKEDKNADKVSKRRNKAPVIALREIAAGYVAISLLENALVRRLRMKDDNDTTHDNTPEEIEEAGEGDIDYIPSGLDLSINQDYSDLDSNMFSDVDIEENTK